MSANAVPAPKSILSHADQQEHLYPSTDAPVSSYYGQPTQVVQQPDWANPHPRR
ncbi:MAG: hypothetical protein GXX96_26855 [Planctomycetaceae bacterium]|nr:hypothetical protein [Planctomycetaceae bacterium]